MMRNRNTFFPTMLLFALVPFESQIGRIFPLLILFLCFCDGIYLMLIKYMGIPNKYVFGYFFFMIWGFCSLVFTVDPTSTKAILLQCGPPALGIFFFSINFGRISRDLQQNVVARCFKGFIFSTCLLSFLSFILDFGRLGSFTKIGVSLFSEGAYTRFSYYLLLACMFSAYLFLTDEKRQKKYLVIFLFLFTTAIFVGIRKSILSPIIFIAIYIFSSYFTEGKSFKGIIKVSTILLAFIGIFFVLNSYSEWFQNIGGKKIEQMISSFFSDEIQDKSMYERSLLSYNAKRAFFMNPITGVGFGAFRYYSLVNGGEFLYAHNNYLELLASNGMIGFLCYYVPLIIQAKNFIKIIFIRKFASKSSVCYFSILITLLIVDFSAVTYISLPFMLTLTLITRKDLGLKKYEDISAEVNS